MLPEDIRVSQGPPVCATVFGLQKTPAQPYELARTSPPQRSAAEPVMTPSHPIIREALGRPGIRNP